MIADLLLVVAVTLLVLGLAALTVSLVGVCRLPTLALKLHAVGIATGIGVAAVLAAAIGTGNAAVMTRAALVAMFMVLTSPLSNHAIAHAARHQRRDEAAPLGRTGGDDGRPSTR